jgi:hypothetical protein
MSNFEILKDLFFVQVQPVEDLEDPQLALGEAGFHYFSGTWILRDPNTGEYKFPNKYEADLSTIAEKLDPVTGVFTAEAVGGFRFFKALSEIGIEDDAYTPYTIYSTLPDRAVVIHYVDNGDDIDGMLPDSGGGTLTLLKNMDKMYGTFYSSSDKVLKSFYRVNERDLIWRSGGIDIDVIRGEVTTLDQGKEYFNQNGAGRLLVNLEGHHEPCTIGNPLSTTNIRVHGDPIDANKFWTSNSPTSTIIEEGDLISIRETTENTVELYCQTRRYFDPGYIYGAIQYQTEHNLVEAKMELIGTPGVSIINNKQGVLFVNQFSSGDVALKMTFTFAGEGVKNIILSKRTLFFGAYPNLPRYSNLEFGDLNISGAVRGTNANIKVIGSNKFNFNTAVASKTINGAGEIVNGTSDQFVSSLINIPEGVTTLYSNLSSGNNLRVVGYRDNGTHTGLIEDGKLPEDVTSVIIGFTLDSIITHPAELNLMFNGFSSGFIPYEEKMLDFNIRLMGAGPYKDKLSTIINENGLTNKLRHERLFSDVRTLRLDGLTFFTSIKGNFVSIPLSNFPGIALHSPRTITNLFKISGFDLEVDAPFAELPDPIPLCFYVGSNSLNIICPMVAINTTAKAREYFSKVYISYRLRDKIDKDITIFDDFIPSNATLSTRSLGGISVKLPMGVGTNIEDLNTKMSSVLSGLSNMDTLLEGVTGKGLGTNSLREYQRVISIPVFEFNLEIPDLDITKDHILIMQNGTMLSKGIDYKIMVEGGDVKLLRWDRVRDTAASSPWETGTIFDILLFTNDPQINEFVVTKRFTSVFIAGPTHAGTYLAPIDIGSYNPETDDLQVHFENVYLIPDMNYEVVMANVGAYYGYCVELKNFTLSNGSVISFDVRKNVHTRDGEEEFDINSLPDDGIMDKHLHPSIKIGDVSLLKTEEKKVVPAINEIFDTLASMGETNTRSIHATSVDNPDLAIDETKTYTFNDGFEDWTIETFMVSPSLKVQRQFNNAKNFIRIRTFNTINSTFGAYILPSLNGIGLSDIPHSGAIANCTDYFYNNAAFVHGSSFSGMIDVNVPTPNISDFTMVVEMDVHSRGNVYGRITATILKANGIFQLNEANIKREIVNVIGTLSPREIYITRENTTNNIHIMIGVPTRTWDRIVLAVKQVSIITTDSGITKPSITVALRTGIPANYTPNTLSLINRVFKRTEASLNVLVNEWLDDPTSGLKRAVLNLSGWVINNDFDISFKASSINDAKLFRTHGLYDNYVEILNGIAYIYATTTPPAMTIKVTLKI